MKGFLEELTGKTFIIRGGEVGETFNDPYEFACVFNVPEGSKVGEFKAYATQPPTLAAIRTAIRIVNDAGYQVQWTRMGEHSYLMQQITGPNGEIRMAKKQKIHDVKDAFDHSKLNHGKVMSMMNHFLKQKESGHYTTEETATQTTLPNGDVKITIEIVRHEVDKTVPAEPAPPV